MNSEAHKVEDSVSEANARLAEMERTQTELSAGKIHLTGENADACVIVPCWAGCIMHLPLHLSIQTTYPQAHNSAWWMPCMISCS